MCWVADYLRWLLMYKQSTRCGAYQSTGRSMRQDSGVDYPEFPQHMEVYANSITVSTN